MVIFDHLKKGAISNINQYAPAHRVDIVTWCSATIDPCMVITCSKNQPSNSFGTLSRMTDVTQCRILKVEKSEKSVFFKWS